jgi:predicted nucleic acid-binding protein
VLPITIAVAQRCARLRRTLKNQGRRVNSRALDLIIAATALEHRLTLVTNNPKDYEDIPWLKLF